MTTHTRWAYGLALAILLVVVVGDRASGQTPHRNGQNVQPAFEGWERNPDGTFNMVFGYLNRNYVEEPEVPVGPSNFFEPGPADRGQPTHFYPRRQSFVFKVTVPADWDKKELVWTVTHNGRTSTAIGWLLPSWELNEGVWKTNRQNNVNSGRTGVQSVVNHPPSIKVAGEDTVTIRLSETVTLTASASDDGVPGPRSARRVQRTRVDIIQSPEDLAGSSVSSVTGLPLIDPRASPAVQDRASALTALDTGLTVSWLHYRGPGAVTFDPRVIPIQADGQALTGKAVTSVHFSEPGTYVIRVVADDSIYTTPTNVTVIVTGERASQ